MQQEPQREKLEKSLGSPYKVSKETLCRAGSVGGLLATPSSAVLQVITVRQNVSINRVIVLQINLEVF